MDRISELSDEVLSYILTTLSMKDLLKTSVLSKRWCKLWGLRKDLDFDIFHVLGSTKEELLQPEYLDDVIPSSSTMERCVCPVDISMDEFVKRVDQFLKNFQGTKIDSFLLNFYFDCKHRSTIDQWLSFAIARGVEKINLLLLAMPYATSHKRYKFSLDLFSETNASTLKHLRLEHCFVCHPTNRDYIPFQNLRSLSLEKTKLDEMFIESLLSNCRWLEELHLLCCEFRSSMPKIVSSSLCHLTVGGCYVVSGNFEKEINLSSIDCFKLISLEYHGYTLDTLNINTPLLKRFHCTVFYCEDPNAFALFATLPKLEIMQFDIYSMVPTSLKITQPFKNLKQLNFILFAPLEFIEDSKFDLLGILTILQASPLLHKLSVMITHPKIIEDQKVVKDINIRFHDRVKVIELGGCVGNWYETEFVINVLRYAHKLERIVLSPYWRERDLLDWNSDPMWFQNRNQRISEKLRRENVVGREKLVLV